MHAPVEEDSQIFVQHSLLIRHDMVAFEFLNSPDRLLQKEASYGEGYREAVIDR
jgi:hypothetical protein